MENENTPKSAGSFIGNKYVRILTAVLVLQAALFYTASHGDAVPLPHPLSQFPGQLGDWHVTQVGVIEKETLDILRADDTMDRNYGSAAGSINLFIAYFKTQRTGQSPHTPKNCLPGSGWSEVSSGTVSVPIPERNETIKINRYTVSKGDQKSLVLYWYQSKRRVIANEFDAKFYLVADSVTLHRSDTSIVKIVVPIYRDQDQQAEQAGVRFVQLVYPALRQFMPS
jgi:EpsI family protein